MFDSLTHALGASPWTYAIVAGIVGGDAVIPLLPGESAAITGGILAAEASLSVVLVVLAAVIGALIGDNCSYLLGRWLGRRATKRLFRGEKAQERLHWSAAQIRRRGPVIVVIARFLPGGRTATTFASGALGMSWRKFMLADAVASVLWAVYATGLGYFGGSAFQHNLWLPLLGSAALGLALGGIAELVRRFGRGRSRTASAR
jgi:membrane protein DedA with SNARE-associated domain